MDRVNASVSDPNAASGFLGAAAILARGSIPVLAPGQVHLWLFELKGDAATLSTCRKLLSSDEAARADRFAFEHLRSEYTVAHGVLRHVLSLYTGQDGAEIRFDVSAAGKPSLRAAAAGHAMPLAFNLSHSRHRALLGLTLEPELGVDLEMERQQPDLLSVADSYFFRSEIAAIRAPALSRQQIEKFFEYWVAKEAVLKGEGRGLGFPLDRFEVSFSPLENSARVTSFDPHQLCHDWTVRLLKPAPGWHAAVALRGRAWGICPIPGDQPHSSEGCL